VAVVRRVRGVQGAARGVVEHVTVDVAAELIEKSPHDPIMPPISPGVV
jgi:hypothetical protein